MPQVSTLFLNLKSELKAKGFTYRDVAEHLGLTEASVKRIFSTEDISLKRLDSICELLNLDLVDLVRFDDSSSRSIKVMTEDQELEIVSDSRMVAVSFLIHNGWNFSDIIKYFDFTESELIQKLARLDKLGLIELLPKNKIRLRVAHNLNWRKKGPIYKYFVSHFQESFLQSDFSEKSEYLRLISGMYSPLSCSIILRKLQKLTFETFQLNQEDRKLPIEERIPFGVLLASRPWHAEFFDQMRRKE